MLIIYILLVAFGVYLLFKLKRLLYPTVTLVSGAVKSGKTSFSVFLVRRCYRRAYVKYLFKKHILRKKGLEMPLIYSNVPLNMNNVVKLTKEHIMRRARFNYDSVVYVCEASLLADSMTYKDDELNCHMSLFVKLFGHAVHGGHLIFDTQSVYDNHFAVKRCVDYYYYVRRIVKWLPFILIFKVSERELTEDDRVTVVEDTDADTKEKGFKYVFAFKRNIWRAFDRYCYSSFTDSKPLISEQFVQDDLKARDIITFRKDIEKYAKIE